MRKEQKAHAPDEKISYDPEGPLLMFCSPVGLLLRRGHETNGVLFA